MRSRHISITTLPSSLSSLYDQYNEVMDQTCTRTKYKVAPDKKNCFFNMNTQKPAMRLLRSLSESNLELNNPISDCFSLRLIRYMNINVEFLLIA